MTFCRLRLSGVKLKKQRVKLKKQRVKSQQNKEKGTKKKNFSTRLTILAPEPLEENMTNFCKTFRSQNHHGQRAEIQTKKWVSWVFDKFDEEQLLFSANQDFGMPLVYIYITLAIIYIYIYIYIEEQEKKHLKEGDNLQWL